nr:integrase, catalytic region, zinc finger, CCHC-type, peptidase aspartic, catalytic [Tanacetum cinerariifolium]
MSTQQDIYAAGSENCPHMLNKENYVPWSSRLLRYAISRPNGKLIHNFIINGPYVRRMIPELADDQAIQTILFGLPKDIYAAVDSCETAQEIWLHVQQMMKGSDIGIQKKKDKLFNEWERFTSTDGESIESYYHHFLKLINDLKRNKHFPEKIASNLKFLNNLQPEWSRHVTIVHQTKDLHTSDYTQLYDFLKYNQKEVDDLKAERLARTQDPLALMATSNNPYTFLVLHQDQPLFNQNYKQQPIPNPKDITDPTNAMNMALALMAKAFKLTYSTPTNNNQRISSNPRNRQIAQPGINMGQDRQMQMNVENQVIQNAVQSNPNGIGNLVVARAEGNATGHNGNQIRCYNCRGLGYFARNYTIRPRRRDAAYLQTQLLIAQKEEAGIQLQAEEFDLMVVTADLDEIEEVNANCILMANLQQASTSGTQTDKAPVYDSDGSAEYTELLEPIPKPHQVPQNDNNVISEVSNVEQSGGTVEKHPADVEETRVLYDSLYNNLAIEVNKLRAQLFDTVSNQKDTSRGTSANTKFAKQSILRKPPKAGETHALSKPVTLNLIPTPQGSKVLKNDKVIDLGMFTINPFKPSREEKHVPNKVRASVRINPITVSQPPDITKKVVNSDSNGLSSTGVDNTKTRRPQPRSNTKNDRVTSTSKSSRSKNKKVEVEEHHRKLLLSRNKKHMSSECNNVKLATQNVKSKVVCAMCKQCLISVNHDVCLLNYVNGMTSRGKKQKANVSINKHQKKQNPKVKKTNKVGSIERLASPKPSKPRSFLRWSPTGRMFDLKGKIIVSSESESQSDYSKGDNACCSKHMTGNLQLLINFVWKFLGTVRFGNDHVSIILGFSDLQWGNILITRVYFVEGLGHNLFSVGQFCDSDLEVAFRRNACFIKNLEVERRNQTLVEAARTLLIFYRAPLFLWAEAIATACFTQNRSIIHRRFNKTPYDLINERKPDISFLHVFRALCYPKNDREDIGKLGAKGDIGVFNGYSANSCAYRVFNRRTKKITKTMNVSFDELSMMAFEQRSSKPRLQSMTSGQISAGLDLSYAPSTITTQQPNEGELDLLFKAMYDDYIGGQPSTAPRIVPASQAHQIR